MGCREGFQGRFQASSDLPLDTLQGRDSRDRLFWSTHVGLVPRDQVAGRRSPTAPGACRGSVRAPDRDSGEAWRHLRSPRRAPSPKRGGRFAVDRSGAGPGSAAGFPRTCPALTFGPGRTASKTAARPAVRLDQAAGQTGRSPRGAGVGNSGTGGDKGTKEVLPPARAGGSDSRNDRHRRRRAGRARAIVQRRALWTDFEAPQSEGRQRTKSSDRVRRRPTTTTWGLTSTDDRPSDSIRG